MIYKRKNSKFWYVLQPIKNKKGQWTKRWISTGTENIEKAREFECSLLKGVKDVIKKIAEKKRVEKFIKDVAEHVTGRLLWKLDFLWTMSGIYISILPVRRQGQKEPLIRRKSSGTGLNPG